MKELMKKAQHFLTFDTPLEMNYISTLFATTHSQNQRQIPEWGHTSTRQKLIANYWFGDVLVDRQTAGEIGGRCYMYAKYKLLGIGRHPSKK